jgi:cell division septation protein DedD
MSSTSETETEILLGNRHLLAIFFVLAVLLGIAFTGGYMVGKNSPDKKPAALTAGASDPAASSVTAPAGSLETHSIPPAGSEQTDTAPIPPPAAEETHTAQPPPPVTSKEDQPLGAPKQKPAAAADPTPPKPALKVEAHVKPNAAFAGPQSGQTFLQVAAVGRTEATALADVLGKKGFRAHAVPKPGASEIYRVLIGPMGDASELSTIRDSLRNAGFTKIFVQRY